MFFSLSLGLYNTYFHDLKKEYFCFFLQYC